MQLEKIQVTDEDIKYTEKILLEEGEYFDDERIAFIKNFETIDLQAVPGSGKTTALLAKLLILERYLPFKNGSGILVISHTNTAVNEIKNRIGKYCPKLFVYPNFVGTIQSFVDQFLAVPYYVNCKKKKPVKIDEDIFLERFNYKYPKKLKFSLEKRLSAKYKSFITELAVNKENKLIHFNSNKELSIPKARNTTDTYRQLVETKKYLLDNGFLNYNDGYFLSNRCLQKFPKIKTFLQKRFKFVFVDEMQDMERHQYNLLEDLFRCDEVVYQRIGDKNQAIYSGEVSLEDIWADREKVLLLKGSYRLSSCVAQIVNHFALNSSEESIIEGRHSCLNHCQQGKLKPHMIVFSDNTIEQVLKEFTKLVKEKVSEDVISNSKHPIKLIGWIKEKDKNGKLGIKSYCKDFEPEVSNTKIFHPSFKSHLTLWKAFSNQTHLIDIARKSILEALITILRKEEITQTNERYFNISSLYKYLRDFHKDFYEEFKLKVFIWSRDVYKGNIDSVLQDVKNFIPNLLNIFKKQIDKSADFINGDDIVKLQEQSGTSSTMRDNVYNCPITRLKVEIGTVHSAKGETHLATLYVETFYRKKHESDRLSRCFCGQGNTFSNETEKKTAKIVYVAMSRPTHLLCFALHQDRFNAIKDNIDGWEIIELAVKN